MSSDSTNQNQLLLSKGWEDYDLLDSGGGKKLERIGRYRIVRPEAEAIWKRRLADAIWQAADAEFIPAAEENGGHWQMRNPIPKEWEIRYKHLHLSVQLSASRHIGFFPEQAPAWEWIENIVRDSRSPKEASPRPFQVLNLFGYSGLATLAAAHGGAEVTHVDASPKAITWAKTNQSLSGMSASKIRWIVDDAIKFVRREARRGTHYDGLILDPPKFGRGPKGEVWEFYHVLPMLLEECAKILNSRPRFIFLTAYAVKASPLTLMQAVGEMVNQYAGVHEYGELAIQEQNAERCLPMAIFCRWHLN